MRKQYRLGTLGVLLTIALVAFALRPSSGVRAAGVPWSDSLAEYGMPATPQMWQPPNWDTQVHTRDIHPNLGIEPMAADHGTDCAAPPATHNISAWQDSIFVCHNHVMTAISDGGYGEDAIMPDRMADWSGGPVTIGWSVSTARSNARDWINLAITPFNEQMTLPFDFFGVDLAGMPLHYISVRADMDTVGSNAYTHWKLLRESPGDDSGFQENDQGYPFFEGTTHIPMSASVRTPFLFTFDQSSYTFKVGPTSAVCANCVIFSGKWQHPLTFTRGVVQFIHHAYNPNKCDVFGVRCGPNTWHWSDFSISNAVQYTLLRPIDHQVVQDSGVVTFGQPAPAGSYFRFSAFGSVQISTDGGATYHAAVVSPGDPAYDNTPGSGHANSYMSPVPAGTTQVKMKLSGGWWGSDNYARDFSIVSQSFGGTPPPPPTPTPVPPTPTPTNPPGPTPTPSPTPIPLNNTPCTVTLPSGPQTGHCSGTFNP